MGFVEMRVAGALVDVKELPVLTGAIVCQGFDNHGKGVVGVNTQQHVGVETDVLGLLELLARPIGEHRQMGVLLAGLRVGVTALAREVFPNGDVVVVPGDVTVTM